MLEKFSLEAQKLIALGESLAFDLSNPSISKEHLFLAFLKNEDSVLSQELKKYHISYINFLSIIDKSLFNEDEVLFMEYAASFKLFLDKAIQRSKELKEDKVSVEVLAILLIESKEGIVADYLKLMKVDKKEVINLITKNFKRKSELDNITDLHDLSKIKKDPLIGRDKELDQLIRALKRRNKPNALIVGKPGIGKTAIVEELAFLLSQNKIKGLENKRIFELDIASVVGGTKYRGEFEEKLKKIIKKVKDDGNAIIFIDEIHNIVKAGGAEGAIDASNILKPYLSRGEIQIIGATTIDEYYQTIAKDKALSRRFQMIKMDQSSKKETEEIVIKLIPIYESFYRINIAENVVRYIVDLAERFLPNKTFPDKAIDVLDNSCVIAKDQLTIEDVNTTFDSFYNISVSIKNKTESCFNALSQDIVGQAEAINKIYKWLSIVEKGIKLSSKPLAVLMFVGPSGVGKSESAKIIAKSFLNNEDAFIRIDMNNFNDSMAINRLIGAAPGYSGSDNKSHFIKTLNTYPNSVILLDEADKASTEVLDFFLNIFDEGYFYDSNHEKVDCSNAIIILTANTGQGKSNDFSKKIHFNVETQTNNIQNTLALKFRPDLLNRMDDIIEFNSLTLVSAEDLISKYKLKFASCYDFEMSSDICVDEKKLKIYGARYIKRLVIQNISLTLDNRKKVK